MLRCHRPVVPDAVDPLNLRKNLKNLWLILTGGFYGYQSHLDYFVYAVVFVL